MAKRYELSDEAWYVVADLFTPSHADSMSEMGVVSLRQPIGAHLYSIAIPFTTPLTTATRDYGIRTLLAQNA